MSDLYEAKDAEHLAALCATQAAQIAALEVEAERLRQCRTCGAIPHPSGKVCICGGTNFVEEEIRNLRLELFAAEAEVGRWKDYELSKDIAEIKSGYADFAPFVALARTTQKFYDWVLATVDAGYLAPVECVDEVHAALAHPTIQRAVKEGHDGATID